MKTEKNELIGRGRTADVMIHEKDQVLKLYKEDFPEDAVRHELLISQWAYEAGLSTPKAYGLISREGRSGIVFQRLQGPTLLKRMMARIWLLDRQARLMASLHHDMHRLEPEAGAPALRPMKAALIHNIRKAPILTEEEKNKVLAYTERLPDESRLCHGDFHPDNIMLEDKPYIIDWMTAVKGSPAADAARTTLLLSIGTMPDGTPRIVKKMLDLIRKRMKDVYMSHYLKLSGLTTADLDRWVLPLAAARLIEWIPPAEKDQLIRIIRERLAVLTP
jgi:aminoglycoside phosphotransferase (APT) family kinase protein